MVIEVVWWLIGGWAVDGESKEVVERRRRKWERRVNGGDKGRGLGYKFLPPFGEKKV